jgi:hypothetical protein
LACRPRSGFRVAKALEILFNAWGFPQEGFMQKRLALIGLGCLVVVAAAAAVIRQQDKNARPSPPAKATCDLGGGKSITIDYSSPRAKGRKVFGGLVPFGQVWRTGANEATTFVSNADLKVGGSDVPAGSYTIFTVPESDKWTLVISKKSGEWGTNYPGPSEDLVRVPMKVSPTSGAVENLTIGFDKGAGGCALRIEWENTRASVDVAKK